MMPATSYHDRIYAFVNELLREVLVLTGGNRTQAARLLGLQRTYLLRLIRERGLPKAVQR